MGDKGVPLDLRSSKSYYLISALQCQDVLQTTCVDETHASSDQLSLAPLLLDLPNLFHAFSEPHHVPFHKASPHLEHGRGQRGDECQVRRDEVIGECDWLRGG